MHASKRQQPVPSSVCAVGVVIIVAIAGVMSGLTLGLLSMDRLDLELMLRTGSQKQERMARR
jgi:metal transporter CNNM